MSNLQSFLKQNGGYGVAVAQELVELLVRVQLPVATQKIFLEKGVWKIEEESLNNPERRMGISKTT